MKINNKNPSALISKGHEKTVIPMTIGDSKLIADLLRKHYQFPLRTAIQEYLSNARDAHRAINQTKKIQVKLPTKKYSFFSIRDFGPGMSDSDFVEYFCKYASSSKKDSNTFTGGFGLGSKIAWAYRDNFFVTNFFNGVKKVYEASTALHYEGGLQLLEESSTPEENGLEILLPIESKDVAHFFECFNLVTYLWGDVEIINYSPDELSIEKPLLFFQSDSLALGTPSKLISQFHKKEWLISLDNIIYPMPHSCLRFITEFKTNKFQIFIKFKSGELTPTIAREYIEESTENLLIIQEKIKTATKEIAEYKSELKKSIKHSNSMNELSEFVNLYTNLFQPSWSTEFELHFGRVRLEPPGLSFLFNDPESPLSIFKINQKNICKKWKVSFIQQNASLYYLPSPLIKKENVTINIKNIKPNSLIINQVLSEEVLLYIKKFFTLESLDPSLVTVESYPPESLVDCLAFSGRDFIWEARKYPESRLKKHELADESIKQVPGKLLIQYSQKKGGNLLIIVNDYSKITLKPTHTLDTVLNSIEWKSYLNNTINAEKNLVYSILKNFKDYEIQHPGLLPLYDHFFKEPAPTRHSSCISPSEMGELLPFIKEYNPEKFNELARIIEQQETFLNLLKQFPDLEQLHNLFGQRTLPQNPATDFLAAIKLVAKYTNY